MNQSTQPNMNIQLPTIRKDIVLMSPGVWNGFEYSADDIKRAFDMTDWANASALFLDHPANPNNAAGDLVGRVINPRYIAGEVLGDLEMWDANTIVKTELAKLKMGVSPRVIGDEIDGSFKNFVFDNFSIVSKPAIDRSYINMSKKNNVSAKILYKTEELNEQIELSKEIKEFNRITEKIQKEEELTDDEYEYMKKKMKKKMKEPTPKEEMKMKGGKKEMSETEKETVSETQLEQPKELGESEKKEEELSFDNLSVEELNAILDKVKNVIASKTPKVQEMAKQDSVISKEIESMRKQIQELNAKLNKPSPKTQKSTGIRAELTPVTHTEGVRELAQMLKERFT